MTQYDSSRSLSLHFKQNGTPIDRLTLYEAASRVGDTSQQLLQLVSASHLYSHRRRRQHLEPILEDENENEQGKKLIQLSIPQFSFPKAPNQIVISASSSKNHILRLIFIYIRNPKKNSRRIKTQLSASDAFFD